MKTHHQYQFVVICHGCGIQPLGYDDYISQMRRSDNKWECPQCGRTAEWDDDCLETNPADCPFCEQQAEESESSEQEPNLGADTQNYEPCQHCFNDPCTCSDFDVSPDMGAK